MPGEEAMLGGETGDAEDLDGLIGDQRTENGRRVPWVVERRGCRQYHSAQPRGRRF
jgi:hypothetical protein